MRLGAIAFLIGVLLLHALPELPSRNWALALPAAGLALALLPRLRPPAWGVAGFLYALLLAPPPIALPAELEGAELWVEGWIATLPDREWRNTRFEFVVDQATDGKQPVSLLAGQRLRLAWWRDGESGGNAADSPPALRVGDRCGFAVRLKRPRGLLNPGGFDYERYLYAKGIIATGALRPLPPPRLLAQSERYPLDRYRQRVV